jgi:transketolase
MAVESLRGAYGQTLLKLGRENPDLVVLDADLAKSTQTQVFAKEFAGRFFDMGLAEQDMISTAAGIALTGKTVFASSFCAFLVGRVFDQIRQSVCYNQANVKLVGTHAGLAERRNPKAMPEAMDSPWPREPVEASTPGV